MPYVKLNSRILSARWIEEKGICKLSPGEHADLFRDSNAAQTMLKSKQVAGLSKIGVMSSSTELGS